ncbi:putative 60s ribosomal protein l40 [Diplodia seriata]|uniref:Putative 60s ribosomal protein l40 n=1 Tax=Diplodia seriata TaxID=420778 RepID=A0A0G2GF02_9PEZI|nr:putative 60s ribosomal protein l40 [Diplodia seriata]
MLFAIPRRADEEEDRNAWTQDDDAWNAFGKKTRIRKPQDDEDEQENAYLQGEAAFQRYVECLQWLLCTQARWLVHTKGMPADLETVVRDLWHIRLRTLSWTQNRDNKPPLRPLDTLVLCYFGLVILQLPVSLHDLHTWLSFSSSLMPPPPAPPAPTDPPTTTTTTTTTTTSNESTHLLYYLTLTHLPAPLLHRLPPTYLAALTPSPLTPSRLQTGLHALARLYRDDLGIAFPPLNFAPLAYRAYVDGLRLPLEALPVVEKLARGAGNADDTLGLPKATALLSGADADEDEDEDEELDGLLRGDQRVFYEAVARQAVMPVSLLVKSVGLIEKKLEESAKKIREGRKRSGVAR